MKLTGNTIIITVGTTGIGLALAKRLSEANSVIICGRSEAARHKAKAALPSLVTRVCDVTDTTNRRAMVKWLEAEPPPLDVLINKDEVLVGVSAQTRQLGEAMFERMTNRA